MVKKSKTFTPPDKKAAAVAEVLKGRPRAEVAEELNVSLPTINLWMAKEKQRQQVTNRSTLTGDETENELRQKVALLEVEVEYLRKKLGIYEGS